MQAILHTSQFEPFLHSVVAELDSGVSLTVLSVLARRDLDPWDEASNYARLSPTEAECQLATLIAESVSSPDADPLSSRLAWSVYCRVHLRST